MHISIPNKYYFINEFDTKNIDKLDKWIKESGLDDNIGIAIKKLYDKRNKKIPKKISSKIGIISVGGIDRTKELISKVLSNVKYSYKLKYDTTPYYIFETSTENTNIESHNEFIKNIQTESEKYDPKIFIKLIYNGKISSN